MRASTRPGNGLWLTARCDGASATIEDTIASDSTPGGSNASCEDHHNAMIEGVNNQVGEAFELGLYTFGDRTPDAQAGKTISARATPDEILAAAKPADASGLDVFAG
jgi:hypothetical protein